MFNFHSKVFFCIDAFINDFISLERNSPVKYIIQKNIYKINKQKVLRYNIYIYIKEINKKSCDIIAFIIK